MRWFFTDDHPLQAALIDEGHTIVSRPEQYATRFEGKYPLSRFLMSLKPDVLVVVFTVPVHKQPVISYSNLMGRKAAVIGAGDDAQGDGPVAKIKRGAWPRCSSSIHNLHGYVTNDEGTAIKVCGDRRVALWNDGSDLAHVLKMVDDIKSGRISRLGWAEIYRESS